METKLRNLEEQIQLLLAAQAPKSVIQKTLEQDCETLEDGLTRIQNMFMEQTKELGLGIYGLTPEQKSENGKRGGTISSTQRWECTETGYITTSGPLTLYQRKRGIDTSKRVRIS